MYNIIYNKICNEKASNLKKFFKFLKCKLRKLAT